METTSKLFLREVAKFSFGVLSKRNRILCGLDFALVECSIFFSVFGIIFLFMGFKEIKCFVILAMLVFFAVAFVLGFATGSSFFIWRIYTPTAADIARYKKDETVRLQTRLSAYDDDIKTLRERMDGMHEEQWRIMCEIESLTKN
jgi:hypothetical protein